MIEIPVFTEQSSDFTQNIDLDNINVKIRLTYNTRVNYWFMALETGESSLQGIKLVKNFLLIDQYKALLPDIPGDFGVFKISNELNDNEFTYDNFGIAWSLFYLTADEVEEFKELNGLE